MNESNDKFYFSKDDAKITIPKGSYEVRDINEFLKHTILWKRSHRDALETVDAVMTIATITPMMIAKMEIPYNARQTTT